MALKELDQTTPIPHKKPIPQKRSNLELIFDETALPKSSPIEDTRTQTKLEPNIPTYNALDHLDELSFTVNANGEQKQIKLPSVSLSGDETLLVSIKKIKNQNPFQEGEKKKSYLQYQS